MKSISVILLLLVIPLYSFCQVEPSGTGKEDDPYLIETLENLQYITIYTVYWGNDKYILQTNDIDASLSQSWYSGAGFKPIGSSNNVFKGNYDGQGYIINNLSINRNEDNCGLFGKIENATIQNVILQNLDISGDQFVGGIAGYATNSLIFNCSTSGNIEGDISFTYIGGIVGVIMGDSQIINCFSSASVTGKSRVGGISSNIIFESEIINCYFTGILNGDDIVGGIVASMNGTTQPTIKNCYSTATINCSDLSKCGMIVGTNMTHKIFSCVYEAGSGLGGVGVDSGVNVVDSTNVKEFSETDMKLSTRYINAGWDFDTKWFLDDSTINNGYPYLYWQQETLYAMLVSDEGNSQSFEASELNTSLEFSSELPPGTQIMVNAHDSGTTPTNGFLASQNALGSTFWRIKTTYPDSISYTLSFDLQYISTSFEPTNVTILKREDVNSDWEDVIDLGAELSWQDKVVSISGLSSFSDFIPVFDDSSLPVELSSFFANKIDNSSVSVNWEVESETNMLGYYLLKNSTNDVANAEQIPSLIHAINTSQHHSYRVVNHPDTCDIVVFYWLKSVELNSEANYYGPVQVILNDENDQHPLVLAGNQLYPNYPNPFNPSTTISFSVDKPQNIEIEIYNVKGQLARHLLSKYISEPNYKHSVVWNGEDDDNNAVSSGTYFINMKLGNKMFVRKAILMK